MSERSPERCTSPSLSRDRRLDQICDEFEAAWRAGRPNPIESYLSPLAEPDRTALLRELLPLEAEYRRQKGDSPRIEDYRRRFPDLDSDWLALALKLPEVTTEMPPAGPTKKVPRKTRIRCPHCRNPVHILDDRPDEVLCPGCGSSFRIQDAHSTESTVSMRLGKFQLLDRIGLGAFGVFWRAHDTELDRVVALKVPHAGSLGSPTDLERFQDEAPQAARLRHPGIVTIHEVSILSGLPVIVSDFIPGLTLRQFLEVKPLTFRESAAVLADVAEALDYAHSQGLVHRDLKPANIMMECSPGTEEKARPLLLDFGLALREQAEVTMTLDGQIIGTPAYMSPEQAAGKGHQADRRSDVFSLGVVLYELLTRELPFRGSRTMLLFQVIHEEPRPLRQINDHIPRDLETITLKAMSKDPDRRYQSAADLAADLRRYLKGEPILARPVGRVERTWRWCRRNPREAALVGGVLALMVLLTVGSMVAAVWINSARRTAEEQQQAAEKQQRIAEEQRKVADSRKQDAEEQRKVADQRRKLVRSYFGKLNRAVDLVLTDVNREKAGDDSDQAENAGRALLESILAFNEEFVQDNPTDPALRADLAQAHYRLGELCKVLGRDDKAAANYTRAIAQFKHLANTFPDKMDYQHRLAVAHTDLAEMLRATNPGEADQHYLIAVDIGERLASSHPGVTGYRQELARVLSDRGIFLARTKQKEAMKSYGRALELDQGLVNEVPNEPAYQADLARVYINQGQLLEKTHADLAESSYRSAIDLLKNHTQKHDYKYRLATAHDNLGRVIEGRVRPQNGDGLCLAAVSVFEPSRAVAGCLMWRSHRLDEAEQAHARAIQCFKVLQAAFPRHHLYRMQLATSYNNQGTLFYYRDEPDKARLAWREAQVHGRTLVEEVKGRHGYHYLLGMVCNNLGCLALDCGQAEPARECLAEAVKQQQAALDLDPDGEDYFDNLLDYYRDLAKAQAELGRYQDVTTLTRKLAADHGKKNRALVRAAAVEAHTTAALAKDTRLGKSDRDVLTEAHALQAMTFLRQAAAQGWQDLYEPNRDNAFDSLCDKSFDSLRQRGDFKKLVVEICAKAAKVP